MKAIALLLSLSLLVITHELGHLCFAKLFHTRVRRFYLFFNWGFSIFKAKKFDGKWHFLFFNKETPESWDEKNLRPEDQDNTLWGIGWLPLGGYCDIAGMVDETKNADDLEEVPQPWEYRTKPAWQRLCIISGGVLVNFLSALIIYACVFAHWGKDELPMRNAVYGFEYHQLLLDEGLQNGDIIYSIDGKEVYDIAEASEHLVLDNPLDITVMRGDSLVELHLSGSLLERINSEKPGSLITAIRTPFVVREFMPGSVASRAGMQVGDSVVALNGAPMAFFSEISPALAACADQDITVGIYRHEGDSLAYHDIAMHLPAEGKMGVYLRTETEVFKVEHHDYTFFQAIPAGISHGWNTLVTYVSSFKLLFAKNGASNLGGFISIAQIFPSEWSWLRFWDNTALLALILAFMNVLPIPGLDGGYILFTLIEMLTGWKPSDKFLTYATNLGFILLLVLLVWANGNDILRLFIR
ncbi:MAG: RIP metalloprotease RseP [Bacteroidales bacterium]|nr:RIP metalloprotease RseP [Bacteroidales bacterium]